MAVKEKHRKCCFKPESGVKVAEGQVTSHVTEGPEDQQKNN